MRFKTKRQREIDKKIKEEIDKKIKEEIFIEIAKLRSEGRYDEAEALESVYYTWLEDRGRNWMQGFTIALIGAAVITNVILMILI